MKREDEQHDEQEFSDEPLTVVNEDEAVAEAEAEDQADAEADVSPEAEAATAEDAGLDDEPVEAEGEEPPVEPAEADGEESAIEPEEAADGPAEAAAEEAADGPAKAEGEEAADGSAEAEGEEPAAEPADTEGEGLEAPEEALDDTGKLAKIEDEQEDAPKKASHAAEDDLPAPLSPSSDDEPIVYGLGDGDTDEGTQKAKPRKLAWLAVGGLAAAAIVAGIAMSAGSGGQEAAGKSGTQTVSVEVADDKVAEEDEQEEDRPLLLTQDSIAEMLSTLTFEDGDVAITSEPAWVEASGGHMVIVHVVDPSYSISPWALVDLTVERCAALAGQLANARYQGDGDEQPFKITELTWNVITLDGDSYMAVSFVPGFNEDVVSTSTLLGKAEGYTLSDGLYYALGSESVGYAQAGGTAPTNAWGEPIVPIAYLASYGNGEPAEEAQ